MLKDIRIGKKLGIGFGVMTALLVLVSAVAIMELHNTSGSFSEYSIAARNAELLGQSQAALLSARRDVRKFLVTGDTSFMARYNEKVAKSAEYFTLAQKTITDPQQKAKIPEISSGFTKYAAGLAELKQLSDNRTETRQKLVKLGDAMSANLDVIEEGVERSGNAAAVAAIGELGKRLLLSQFNALYFSSNSDVADINKVPTILGDEFAADLAKVRQGVTDSELLRRLDQLQSDAREYIAGAAAVKKAIMARYAIEDEVVEKLGDQMTAGADEIKDMIREEQNALGQQVEAAGRTGMIVGISVTLFGLLLSFFVARTLTKGIAGSIVAIADTAKQFAQGEIDREITIHQKDEVGVLADAFREMQGRLQKIAVQTGVLVDATDEGQLGVRADTTGFEGGWRRMIEGLNRVADAYATPIRMIGVFVDRISKGDIPPKITDPYRGEFNVTKGNLNDMVDALQSIIADINLLVDTAVAGKLSVRADGARHRGEYRHIVEGLNATLDAISAPINEAAAVLERLANYDLCARMQGESAGDFAKIKDSMNRTAEGLHDAIAQVNEAVSQMASATAQIAATSQTVAQGASEQASALEETSSALEQMTGQTKQNADNTQQARAVAKNTQQLAEKGNTAMRQMVAAMTNIRKSAEDTSAIIKDINEIAFQTNLLALNAAVEAARAGDVGRGFAVVAEEVRNLALRAKEAASKTEALIAQSAKLANEGGTISGEVNENLAMIVDSIGKVADFVDEIAVASEEQAKGIAQVNRAVSEMDKVVQQSAASSEESSSAAEELSSQSQDLAGMVGRFRLSGQTTRDKPMAPAKALRAPSKPKSTGAAGGPGKWPSRLAAQVIPLDDDEALRNF